MANLVTFAKRLWKDKVGGNTPITAAELNRMEDGINNCATQINRLGDSVSLEWWATSITFRLDTTKTFAVVEAGVPGETEIGPFMIWFSSANPTATKLPEGITVSNVGRDVTVSYRGDASFVVRKYVC